MFTIREQSADSKFTQYQYFNPSPNSMLAIFRDQDSVDRIVNESPLRFMLEPVQGAVTPSRTPLSDLYNKLEADDAKSKLERTADGWQASESRDPFERPQTQAHAAESEGAAANHNANASTSTTWTPSPTIEATLEDDPDDFNPDDDPPSARAQRYFLLHAQPWIGMGFAHHLARTPYCGPYPIDTKSAAQQDLIEKVPLPGLSMVDMKQPSVLGRIVAKRAEALKARRTLREIMEGKERDGSEGALDDVDQFDVRGIMTGVKDGDGGHVGLEEVGRRAKVPATDIGIDDWGDGGGDDWGGLGNPSGSVVWTPGKRPESGKESKTYRQLGPRGPNSRWGTYDIKRHQF